MSVQHFGSFNVGHVGRTLEKLHEDVARFKGRIEVTREGCDDCCVLISKAELESLEQALAILSNTEGVRAMSGQIAQLAATCQSTASA